MEINSLVATASSTQGAAAPCISTPAAEAPAHHTAAAVRYCSSSKSIAGSARSAVASAVPPLVPQQHAAVWVPASSRSSATGAAQRAGLSHFLQQLRRPRTACDSVRWVWTFPNQGVPVRYHLLVVCNLYQLRKTHMPLQQWLTRSPSSPHATACVQHVKAQSSLSMACMQVVDGVQCHSAYRHIGCRVAVRLATTLAVAAASSKIRALPIQGRAATRWQGPHAVRLLPSLHAAAGR